MRPFFCPAHLLAFDKPFADHLIDCGFYKPRRDLFPVPIAITIISRWREIGTRALFKDLEEVERIG
jgi:hypothetical protein